MSQIRTSMIIDLAGNLAGRASHFLGSMRRLGQGGSRSMQLLQRSVHAAGQGLDRLGNRYTALLSGAAGIGAARQVMELDERFTRLGIDASKSADEIAGLKQRIFEAAQAPEIRIDPGEITGAVEEIIQKTGDLRFAQANIRNIGLAIQATGAQGKDIGGIMAEFQKMGIIDPKDTLEALDTLILQGKEGAFTLKELAALGPRVITAYTSKGRGGVAAIREMGAALQMIRMGTGSSEMAATSFENLMKTLTDNKKLKMLQAGGIQVFDPEAAKQGREVLRPVNELMAEIITKTKGKSTLLGQIFDAEAIRAFNQAAGEFQRTGSLESLDRFYKVQADGTTITRDSARAANTAKAALQGLNVAWTKFADDNLAGPIRGLTETLNALQPGTVERWLKIATHVAAVGGGVILARKALSVGGMFGGSKEAGGRPGMGGLGSGAGPIPVYVVNKHLSMLPGQGWGFPEGSGTPGGAAGTVGKLAKVAKAAGAVTQVGAAAAVGYTVGEVINEVIGAGIGKLTDGKHKGAGAIGEWLYDALHKADAPARKTEVGGELTVKIESDVPARVTGMKTRNSRVPLNVDSGLTMRSY